MRATSPITKTLFFPIEDGIYYNHLVVHQVMYSVFCFNKFEPLILN